MQELHLISRIPLLTEYKRKKIINVIDVNEQIETWKYWRHGDARNFIFCQRK
jgi:hypothetical protein